MNESQSMIKPLSLLNNSIWNTVGSVVYALTQWGVLIIIAKLGNPEMLGMFTLGLALTSPVVLLMRFDLRLAVASDSNNEFAFNDYFSSRVIATILFVFMMLIVSFLYAGDPRTSLVILILSLAKAIESISDILHGQMQKNDRLDLTAKARMLKGILSLAIFTCIMYTTHSLILSALGFMIAWLLILIMYDIKVVKLFGKITFHFDKKTQLLILKLSIPLGLAQLLASLHANVPRYFIENAYGVEALGFFAAMIYIANAGNEIIIAISNATLTKLSRYYQNAQIANYVKLIAAFTLFILVAGIAGLFIVKFFGEWILELLYTPAYTAYHLEFFIIMSAGVIMYIGKILEIGITATRKFIFQPYINTIALCLIIILSFILIPKYNIMGVGFTLLLAEFLQVIVRAGVLVYVLKWHLKTN